MNNSQILELTNFVLEAQSKGITCNLFLSNNYFSFTHKQKQEIKNMTTGKTEMVEIDIKTFSTPICIFDEASKKIKIENVFNECYEYVKELFPKVNILDRTSEPIYKIENKE